jgi:peptidoglycan/xylan/chitin deacetylase (PgdA/CDA1 family)
MGEPELNLKRSAKILALKTASSPPGSNPALAWRLLRLLHVNYGPVSPTRPEADGRSSVACVSVDFDVTKESRFDDNRKGTLALNELAARYGIPITWAICGKSAEADMKSYSAIVDSAHLNEIGVHTYSHIDASVTPTDQFRSDVERCIQVLGLESPRTFVFPWNKVGHFDVLRALGFRVFRGKTRAIGNPVLREGLWNVRPVYYVNHLSKGAESLIKTYVDLCVKLSTPFHLWTHPWSLAIGGKTEPMMETLESVFAYIAEKREQNALTTSTLGGIATTLDMDARGRGAAHGSELIRAPGLAG